MYRDVQIIVRIVSSQKHGTFDYGKLYTKETEDEIIEALKPSHIAGLTLLGGEPFEPENQRELVKLLRRVRKELPEKNIWSFTGFILDQDLLDGGRKHCEVTDEMLSLLDVLVDGPFKEEAKRYHIGVSWFKKSKSD